MILIFFVLIIDTIIIRIIVIIFMVIIVVLVIIVVAIACFIGFIIVTQGVFGGTLMFGEGGCEDRSNAKVPD